MSDYKDLYDAAIRAVVRSEELFAAGFGSGPATMKGSDDFATQVDLDIEAQLRRDLGDVTGIPVYGEEDGGDIDARSTWIVDPIDGTANFAARNPLCSILVALMVDGEPVVSVVSMPMIGLRVSAYLGSGVISEPVSAGVSVAKEDSYLRIPRRDSGQEVGFSTVSRSQRGIATTPVRHGVLTGLADSSMRPRITGSVGVDLAFAAIGIFNGAISLSPNIWDNASGVLLAREAGLIVTNALGQPWADDASGVVAGTPDCHDELVGIIAASRPSPHTRKKEHDSRHPRHSLPRRR